eukprot:TRINITY_DN17182_c0_g1_i2.p1 TRINITY_DN17182_c0_g1~~TRINITY_DN17182_c0_g1_i2.p1  ORF type:complete len:331 (+),score=48.16 TRINITY_DN17182_c0_g1_i2:64-1056(+)
MCIRDRRRVHGKTDSFVTFMSLNYTNTICIDPREAPKRRDNETFSLEEMPMLGCNPLLKEKNKRNISNMSEVDFFIQNGLWGIFPESYQDFLINTNGYFAINIVGEPPLRDRYACASFYPLRSGKSAQETITESIWTFRWSAIVFLSLMIIDVLLAFMVFMKFNKQKNGITRGLSSLQIMAGMVLVLQFFILRGQIVEARKSIEELDGCVIDAQYKRVIDAALLGGREYVDLFSRQNRNLIGLGLLMIFTNIAVLIIFYLAQVSNDEGSQNEYQYDHQLNMDNQVVQSQPKVRDQQIESLDITQLFMQGKKATGRVSKNRFGFNISKNPV